MSEVLDMADSECRELWDELSLSYPLNPQGHPYLVDEIINQNGHGNLDCTNLNVLAPQEGIFLGMHALLEPGDNIIVTTPAYQSLFEVARSIGCSVTPWEVEQVEIDGVRSYYFDPGTQV